MNALRSGIDAKSQVIHFETPAELEYLKNEYRDRFHPITPVERMLVDTLIDCEWLLRRFRRIEAQLWDDGMQNTVHKSILGEAFRRNCDAFARLQRRVDSTQRNYRQSLHELERLQAAESAADPDSDAQLSPETEPAAPSSEPSANPQSQTSNPEIGFVPPTPSDLPATPAPITPFGGE